MSQKKLSKEVVDTWPEVFENVKLNVIPIRYLCSITITFRDQRVWTVNIKDDQKKNGWEIIEHNIDEMIKNYKRHIINIDFKLDTVKIKRDVTKLTNKFLKKYKI